MFVHDLMAAFIVALFLSLILSWIFRWRWPGRERTLSSVLVLFIVLFLIIWVGGIWVVPFGPPTWGIYWLPFIAVGVLFSVILIALIPPRRPRTMREAKNQAERRAATAALTETALGVFFWIMMIVLIGAIIMKYA
jgi:hypothetical protein